MKIADFGKQLQNSIDDYDQIYNGVIKKFEMLFSGDSIPSKQDVDNIGEWKRLVSEKFANSDIRCETLENWLEEKGVKKSHRPIKITPELRKKYRKDREVIVVLDYLTEQRIIRGEFGSLLVNLRAAESDLPAIIRENNELQNRLQLAKGQSIETLNAKLIELNQVPVTKKTYFVIARNSIPYTDNVRKDPYSIL